MARMRVVTFTGLLLFCVATRVEAGEEFQVEHITDEAGNPLTLNITHSEAEEDVDVLDDNGKSVIKVEFHEHDGYQVEKPANDSVCLLSEIEEYENKTFCYNRIDFPAGNVTRELQDHCEGRTIYVLVPKECEPSEVETALTEAPPSEGAGRAKRSWCCYWRSYYTLKRIAITRCCRWFCSRKCVVGYQWKWVRVTYYTCSYYW